MNILEPLEILESIQDQSSKQKTQINHLRTRKNIAIRNWKDSTEETQGFNMESNPRPKKV